MVSVANRLLAGRFVVRIPLGARDLFLFPETLRLTFNVSQVRFRGMKSPGC